MSPTRKLHGLLSLTSEAHGITSTTGYWLQMSQCGQLRPNGREVALQTSMWDERYYCGHLWKMQHATGHVSSITQYHKRDGAMREGLCLLDVPRDAHGRLGQGSGVPLSEASTRVSRSPYL